MTLPVGVVKLGRCYKQPELQELFFAFGAAKIEAAKAICNGCPIKVKCRNDARVTHGTAGVWGGESEEDRLVWQRRHLKQEEVLASAVVVDIPEHLIRVRGEGNVQAGLKGTVTLVTDEHLEWFRRLHADGWSYTRIARAFGFGKSTVADNMKEAA